MNGIDSESMQPTFSNHGRYADKCQGVGEAAVLYWHESDTNREKYLITDSDRNTNRRRPVIKIKSTSCTTFRVTYIERAPVLTVYIISHRSIPLVLNIGISVGGRQCTDRSHDTFYIGYGRDPGSI